ncbi:MAG: 6-hydroxymethylpterin diphosphokinase MptE-like protein [Pseudomonadota bacterium]|nr:6-hydroxymethylpterin diphosphokinase MptE-like protein [Pseudomonadota bacterium]
MGDAESGGFVPPGFAKTTIQTRQDQSQVSEMLASVEINCRRITRQDNVSFLRIGPERDGQFIICGNGPSLRDTVDRIKALDRPENRIVAMNGAGSFLYDNGINVWATVAWETATTAICKVTELRLPMKYLIASRAHPDWCAHLHDREIILWHCLDDVGEREIIDRFDESPVMVAGGTSHALRSIEIGRAMGFRKFQMFGCDGNYRDGVSHSNGHFQQPSQHFKAFAGGQVFETCHGWAQQAIDTVEQYRAYKRIEARDGTPFHLVIHGDGLIQAFAREHGIPTI